MIASAAVIFSLGHKQQQNAIIGRCVGYLSYIRDIDIRDTIIASVFIYLPYSTYFLINRCNLTNHRINTTVQQLNRNRLSRS